MTAVSPSRPKKNRLLHWQPASWNEYVRVRNYHQELEATSDLDKKKRMYAMLGIAEYWVIDVAGRRAFLFCLDDSGQYQEFSESKILVGATDGLFRQAMLNLKTMSNMQVANWFREQLSVARTSVESKRETDG